MRDRFRQENTTFFSPLTESSSCEEFSELEVEEELDHRLPHMRKKSVLQCLAHPHLTLNEESP